MLSSPIGGLGNVKFTLHLLLLPYSFKILFSGSIAERACLVLAKSFRPLQITSFLWLFKRINCLTRYQTFAKTGILF